MLQDMERQIERFQTHLDFVDEVINDIKQLDYDIFKEIRDIKAAFAFNQVRHDTAVLLHYFKFLKLKMHLGGG